MWARQLQACHRRVRVSSIRQWRRQQSGGPHKTYFQPPPEPPKSPRRIFRTILLGTICAGAGYFAALYNVVTLFEDNELLGMPGEGSLNLEDVLKRGSLLELASYSPPTDGQLAQYLLELYSGSSVQVRSIMQTCSVGSNLPCEDAVRTGCTNFSNRREQQWEFASIFDGHAGPKCANLLASHLMQIVAEQLIERGYMKRAYRPEDQVIARTIKAAFLSMDQMLIGDVAKKIADDTDDRSYITGMAAVAYSGSCALLALFDPNNSVLRVANVGDSRAVLGRWDESEQRYIAIPLSHDHTGFNPSERARLEKEHPGEKVIDPETGRVHGLAVTRAFGDARWKWPQELSHRAHRLFLGPRPRPDEAIKTPPYLTVEPEILEAKIQEEGPHPDFLIMASDGLWDHMSSENAVTCVQMWLDKNNPVAQITGQIEHKEKLLRHLGAGGSQSDFKLEGAGEGEERQPRLLSADELVGEYDEMADTYYDEKEKCMRWKVEPEHFVVEDDHAGVHLVKNAFGGRRKALLSQVMSVMPPNSRDVRDDVSVVVWFFGQETKRLLARDEALRNGEVFEDREKEGERKKKGWFW